MLQSDIPTELHAGVSLDLLIVRSAHPAPDWSVALHLRGPAAIDIAATAEGSAHRMTATAAETAAWMPGRYWYQLRATDAGGETCLLEDGHLDILPDLLSAGAGFDGRSHAERVLDAIEAVIEGRATQDQQSYTINNRSLSRTPLADLLLLRERYRAQVVQQRARERGRAGYGRQIRVVF